MWGSSFAFTKIAVTAIAVDVLVATRVLIATAVLVCLVVATGRRLPNSPRVWGVFLLMAIVGNCLPFLLVSWGQQTVDSGLAGILMAVMPLATLVLASVCGRRERFTRTKSAGFVLGFLGVVVLMGPETLSSFQTNGAALAAQLAIIGGAICYAVNTLLAERYAVADGLIAAAGTTIAANVILLPLTLHDLGGGLSGLTVSSGLAVLALGVISTGLAPVLYLRLIRATGPTYVSLISYLIPAWAVLLGVVFLGETLGWSALIAMGLILGGIALSQRAPVASGDLNPDKSAGMDRASGSIKQNRRGVPSERDHDDRRGRNVHI